MFACPWLRGNSMLDCASLTSTVAIPLELAPVRETLCDANNAMLIGCKHGKSSENCKHVFFCVLAHE
jgi:hypothetical protein